MSNAEVTVLTFSALILREKTQQHQWSLFNSACLTKPIFYSYFIIRSTTQNPSMLVIHYTEVSTLLIQEVALAPTN